MEASILLFLTEVLKDRDEYELVSFIGSLVLYGGSWWCTQLDIMVHAMVPVRTQAHRFPSGTASTVVAPFDGHTAGRGCTRDHRYRSMPLRLILAPLCGSR